MNKKKSFSIRLRIISVIALSILLLSLLVYLVSTNLLLSSYERIEKDQITQNVDRANDAVLNTIAQLNIKLSDWAWWDDSYQFIKDRNQDYVDSNLNVESIFNLNINAMVFMTSSGEVVFKRLIDINKLEEISSEKLGEYISANEIFRIKDLESKVQGIIVTPDGPMLIVTLPVLTSHGEGPIHGTISFGRFLDEDFVLAIRKLTHLSVTIYLYEGASLPKDVVSAKAELLGEEPIYTIPISKDLIAGYSVLPDIYGKPALILKVETSRDVYNQGLSTFSSFMVISAGFILAFGMVIIILIEILFVSRFSKLSKEVEHIGETKDFKERLAEGKNDEIGVLGFSINKMLDILSASREAEAILDRQIKEKNIELSTQVSELENSKMAVINLLDDLKQEKGKVEAVVVERTRELTSEKARLLASINSLSFGFIIADMDNHVLLKNRAMIELFGLDESEERSSIDHISELLEAQFDIKNRIQLCLKDKNVCEIKEISSKDKYLRGIIAPVITPDNNELIGYVFLLEDITEARLIDRAKSEFVSLASHQLRTPLSSINWYTEILTSGDAGPLNEEQKDYVTEVSNASRRMSDMVGMLLNVSRIELGTFIIEPIPTNICALLEDQFEQFKVLIDQKHLETELVCNQKDITVNLDPMIMSIVIQNLISNAIKYTGEKGRIKIELFINEAEHTVSLVVSDNGYGIEASQQNKIFTKLFRADNIKTKDTEGNGLGLYMVKTMLEQAGCSIRFESKENEGTRFFVTIPESGMKKKAGSRLPGEMKS